MAGSSAGLCTSLTVPFGQVSDLVTNLDSGEVNNMANISGLARKFVNLGIQTMGILLLVSTVFLGAETSVETRNHIIKVARAFWESSHV